MGKNIIGKLMQRVSKKAGLSQIYSAHCVRASMITILFRAGVQPKEICHITKHKRESSLDSYIRGSSSAQKRQCSNVLSNALGLQPVLNDVNSVENELPDDVLNMALDLEEAIVQETGAAVPPSNVNQSSSSMVQINQTNDQTANFNLVVPGIDWQSMMNAAKPNIHINNCNVTLNFGGKQTQ